MLKTFHIYHTNDLHSHFLHWPQIAAYFKDAKKDGRDRGEPVLQFDIGDHLDRFHPMTEGTAGAGNVRLLNALDYDAITIGNNEGITLTKEQLEHLYADANFPVLVANLFHRNGVRPARMKPYALFSLENGLTVGAIGMTIPFVTFYEPLGWEVRNPQDMLPELVREVKEKADFVVLLSHLGYSFDQQIARDLAEIDLILGAHTHHLLKQGVNVEGTTILQAGKFGNYVGEVHVTFDTESGQVEACEANSVSIEGYRTDEAAKKLLSALNEEARHALQTPVAELDEPLVVSWDEPSGFAALLAEALREWCDADIGMVNAGVLLESLPAGKVTKEDLHRVCPHPINPCKLTLRGNELLEVIRQSFTEEMQQREVRGLGFRGKILGAMAFDGLAIERKKGRIDVVRINGMPLDPKSEYEVATLDMFTFGMIFPGFAEKEKQYFLPEMLRDVLAWKLS